MKLRMAVPGDAPALLDIYGAYIPTNVTFEYERPGTEEFRRRIARTLECYPYLVAEEGRPLGYAYAHRLAERAAYGWSAELSIYLRPDAARRGTGKRLYRALMELLRLQGVRTVYGLVASPNPGSEALHKSLGFRLAGVEQKVGYKNGGWVDLLIFERSIAPYGHPGGPIRRIGELAAEEVARILEDG